MTMKSTGSSPWELPEDAPTATDARPKLSDKPGTVHAILAKVAEDLRASAKMLDAVLEAEEAGNTEDGKAMAEADQEKIVAVLGAMVLSAETSTRDGSRALHVRMCELDPEGMRRARLEAEAWRGRRSPHLFGV